MIKINKPLVWVSIFAWCICYNSNLMSGTANAQARTVARNSASTAAEKFEAHKKRYNENTVMIITGQTSGSFLKMAEEMQNVLDNHNDHKLRILPIVGVAGTQNLADILFLRGVDMCFTEANYFDYMKEQDPQLYGDIDKKINYIAKLFNTEFHIVAGKDINTVEDLRGKKVNFFLKDSSGDISGRNLFKMLGVEVEGVNFDQAMANEKLRRGEISAVVRLAGAPVNAFADLKAADGFHFVPIDIASHGGLSGKSAVLSRTFLPTRLKAEDYPSLIPAGQSVSTVASSVVLATYAWPEGSERYQRTAKFVNVFFDNIEKFKEKTRHPKWAQTNLATEVPGWTRFKAAQNWLNGKRAEAARNAGAAAR
jgi:uncharacterized protein